MIRKLLLISAAWLFGVSVAQANITFTFLEVGSDVVMTPSGVLNTNNLVQQNVIGGWGGIGLEQNGQSDIMGSTIFGQISITFGFHAGTNFTPWTAAPGPWDTSSFNWGISNGGQRSFATYALSPSFVRVPGIGMRAIDLTGGLWTPDQTWINANDSFATLGLHPGTYTISDAVTSESITIQIGVAAVPGPVVGAGLPGLVMAFGGLIAWRRRRNQATVA